MNKLSIWAGLVLVCILLFIPGIAALPVVDRDEAHFAQATKQMLQTGNYFQIRFQDRTRFQKPPGINWMQSASVSLFNSPKLNDIWSYRLPSVICAIFSVLFTYLFSRRFIPERAALLAATLLACSLLLIVESHMAVIDASLLFSVVLMQGALWVIYQKGIEKHYFHWGWSFCFWLALSFGTVLKGVTPLIGFLSITTLCVVERRLDWLVGLRAYWGLGFFLVFNVAWLGMVNEAEHSNYLMEMFHRDLLPKLQGGHESHGAPPLFHLFILPMTFWPGSLFLWAGGVYAWTYRQTRTVTFLLAWLLPSWIFFECMPTKLPQYVLPLFPPLAILCAMALNEHWVSVKSGKWVSVLQVMWGGLSVAFAFFIMYMGYFFTKQLMPVSIVLSVFIIMVSGIAIYYGYKGKHSFSFFAVLGMALLTFPLVFVQVLPNISPIWLTKAISEQTRDLISAKEPLLVAGFDEPSLVFNLNTDLVRFVDDQTAIKSLTASSSQVVVFDRKIWESLSTTFDAGRVIGRVEGFNYNKGKWTNLVLVQGK